MTLLEKEENETSARDGSARFFRAAINSVFCNMYLGYIAWYLPGFNTGRKPPRAAPLYLVTITLGCMKCATGIQPSPHNSPIYDWAKLLSMRRIKSRARVREKSAGRRDGTSASPRAAPRQAAPSLFPGRDFLPGQVSIGEKRLGDSEFRSRATTLSSPTHGASAWHRFPSNFSRDPARRDSREIKYRLSRSRARAALRSSAESANRRSNCLL